MPAVLARPSAALPAVVAPLAEEARGYALASKADNTRTAYRVAWRDFLGWCDAQGLPPLPAAPATVGLCT
jgi:hypothetical protein